MEEKKAFIQEFYQNSVQETGQKQRPARRVGLFGLDSTGTSKDAVCSLREILLQWRGET